MANETNNFQETFMDVATKKMGEHDTRIRGLEEKLKNQPDHSEEIKEMKVSVGELKTGFDTISFPVEEMKQLSGNLKKAIALFENPAEQKVMHHHYLNKALWVGVALFVAVNVLVVLLVNAWNRNSNNRESDIKYRHLKLYTDKSLRTLLRYEDSIYLDDPEGLFKNVTAEEARRKEKAELLLLSKEKEEESKQLKKKADSK